MEEYGHFYNSVHFDKTNVEAKVEQYRVREWNVERFSVLGKIHQESMQYALEIGADFYFVMDVDNCVVPETLQELVDVNLPIVAPLTVNANDKNNLYANFFAAADKNVYYQSCEECGEILMQKIKGLIKVPAVHCTYLVRTDVVKHLTYGDRFKSFEFAIFSRSARKNGISQYIDNRQYGWLVLDEDVATLKAKIYPSCANIFATYYKTSTQ